jgi:2-keto-4-pentenoate hydratase/2-oxohepta-3-ene-1,7-dioic acid hydratase in catechol pathway
MRLATFRRGKERRLGIIWGTKVIDFVAGARFLSKKGKGSGRAFVDLDMRGFLNQGASAVRMAKKVEIWAKERAEGKTLDALGGILFNLSKVKLLPPISNPPKIMCLARNYVSHVKETASDGPAPTDLLVFLKPATAIIGPKEPVVVPPDCKELDHEVELAVVVGKRGRYIPREKAMDHVAGYTVLNDVSDREHAGKNAPNRMINWFFMKAQDSFAPMGPFLVLKDEIKEPHGLRLRLWVNGELRQDSMGEEMIFKIPEIISRISRFVTIEPGDVIGTGTPTGTSFSTQRYLKAGDVMECEIEGIGRLRNCIKTEEPVYRTR